MVLSSGCAGTNYKAYLFGDDLPDMPKAGKEVARELEVVCDDVKCLHLNNWLNELYFFKQEYLIYKTYKAS
jgi:hypothetical protein